MNLELRKPNNPVTVTTKVMTRNSATLRRCAETIHFKRNSDGAQPFAKLEWGLNFLIHKKETHLKSEPAAKKAACNLPN